jgi:hypothetical protein
MDADYPSHTASYFDDTPLLEILQLAQYASPEEETQSFDIPLYTNYEVQVTTLPPDAPG